VLRKVSRTLGDYGAQPMLVGAFACADWDTVSPHRALGHRCRPA